jgi:predicted dehydrogenase
MSNDANLSRRQFLSTCTTTAATLGAAGGYLAAAGRASAQPSGANDRLRIGVIGSGGQGTYDAIRMCRADNVVCVAVSDVAEFRLADATKRISQTMAAKGYANVKIDQYRNFHKLLERKDIDAVIIATPDHWHYRAFKAALDAGKHVYQEKPMSYTIEQGLEMVDFANRFPKCVVQIGTQRRSGEHYAEARQFIEEGGIGKITYARAYDCRNFVKYPDPFAPRDVSGEIDWDEFQEPCDHKVAYDPWRYFAWRWYWDYAGGLVTDVGVHVIDVVHWLTGSKTPISAACNGGVYSLDYWETPDVVNAVWDYGTHAVTFVSNLTNGWQGGGLSIFGIEGTVEVRGEDIFVWEENDRGQRGHGRRPLKYFRKRGKPHQENFVASVREGLPVKAPVELGFSSLLPSHLANLAYRSNREVKWDADKQKVV